MDGPLTRFVNSPIEVCNFEKFFIKTNFVKINKAMRKQYVFELSIIKVCPAAT